MLQWPFFVLLHLLVASDSGHMAIGWVSGHLEPSGHPIVFVLEFPWLTYLTQGLWISLHVVPFLGIFPVYPYLQKLLLKCGQTLGVMVAGDSGIFFT